MINLITAAVIIIILGCSIGYIVKAKKSGVHCIGCPAGGSCSGHCASEQGANVNVIYKDNIENVHSVSEAKDKSGDSCGCASGSGCNCTADNNCGCGGK